MRIALKTTGEDLLINPRIIDMISADYSKTGVRLSSLKLKDGSTVLHIRGWPAEIEKEIERLSEEQMAAARSDVRDTLAAKGDAARKAKDS